MKKRYCFVVISIYVAHFMAINGEGDRVWRPLHLISVPSVGWIAIVHLDVVLNLFVAIAVDDICRDTFN